MDKIMDLLVEINLNVMICNENLIQIRKILEGSE